MCAFVASFLPLIFVVVWKDPGASRLDQMTVLLEPGLLETDDVEPGVGLSQELGNGLHPVRAVGAPHEKGVMADAPAVEGHHSQRALHHV